MTMVINNTKKACTIKEMPIDNTEAKPKHQSGNNVVSFHPVDP
jgi:hypothetical protein